MSDAHSASPEHDEHGEHGRLGEHTRHGRHRRPVRAIVLVVAGALAVALIGVDVAVALRDRHEAATAQTQDCTHAALRVTVVPELAPVVSALAGRARVCGSVVVQVTAADSAGAAADLIRSDSPRPDVWIPDSTMWTASVGSIAATPRARNTSVATSPVVLAVPSPAANRLRDAVRARRLGFAQVAATATTADPIVLAAGDPRRSASAAGVLATLRSGLGADESQRGILAAFLRTTTSAPVTDSGELADPPVTADGAPVAVASSERQVWNTDRISPREYTAVYPPAPRPSLDYPFVVLTRDAGLRAAAARLFAQLRSAAGQRALLSRGFRLPDGRAGSALRAAAPELDADASAGPATRPGQVAAVLAAMGELTKPTRLLALIDVSGSMATPVGSGTMSRIDVARTAAQEGLALLPQNSSVGLWRFSADLTPSTDYQQLAPVTRLTPLGRAHLASVIEELHAVPNGGTGLYDSVLAAVRSVRAGYDPSRVNSVVVLTDGRDEAPPKHHIALDSLLAQLRAQAHSSTPVKVIAIADGRQSDIAALGRIAGASGGIMYRSLTPADLPTIFREAIGQRLVDR